jgi:phage terminase small subunit
VKELTIKAERFCQEYVNNGGNADEAHEAAYGYSIKNNGFNNVSRLLNDPRIFLKIQEFRAEISDHYKVTRERIVEELACVAFSDLADYMDHDGKTLIVKSLSDLPRRLTRAVSQIEQIDTASGPVIRLKFHDKLVALDKLNKMAGNYANDHIDVKVNFVLRAPTVEKTTDDWVARNPVVADRKFLDLEAKDITLRTDPIDYQPLEHEVAAKAPENPSALPEITREQRLRLDGNNHGPKPGSPKRIP